MDDPLVFCSDCPAPHQCAEADECCAEEFLAAKQATEDRKWMGAPTDAEAALAAKAREWRELRQPSMATAKQHKDKDRREHQVRFELANAALLWLWHLENPA